MDRTLEEILAKPRSECESEPIHQVGSIQPHGAVAVLDLDGTVLSTSGNFRPLTGLDTLPANAVAIARTLAAANTGAVRSVETNGPPDGSLLIRLVRGRNEIIADCEAVPLRDRDLPARTTVTDEVLGVLEELSRSDNLDSLADIAGRAIRSFTGFERVLVYRFDEDGHGDVIWEGKTDDWDESLMGLHFPEGDIPAQARALYLENLARFTPFRDFTPVPLSPRTDPRTGKPFDLTHSMFRSPSPIHQAYQRNLGVDGAMSLSVLHQGRLWGMIVGHSRGPNALTPNARNAAMLVNQAFAMRVGAVHTLAERDARVRHTDLHSRMLEQIAGADDFVDALTRGPISLTDMFEASSSVAVVYEGEMEHTQAVAKEGNAPPDDIILAYAGWLREHRLSHQNVHATECISGEFPDFAAHAAGASGALSLLVGEDRQHMIIWFRPEVVREITWGGREAATKAANPAVSVLPRESFERWVEVKRRHSKPWPVWMLTIADSLRVALNDLILRQIRVVTELNKQLEISNRAKSDFIASMSHELRTPLNAVLGFSEAMSEGIGGTLSESHASYIGSIRQAGAHLLSLVNDILDLSKIEAGRFELQAKPLRLIGVIESVARIMAPVAERGDVALTVEADDPGLIVRADERAIRQIVMNLVSNAIKFTKPKGRVTVTLKRDPLGDTIIAVEDTGVGIPQAKMATVMEPFTQVKDESSDIAREHSGTGLGLPISKSLIELHGGGLTIESTLGKGTRIEARLPVERIES